MRAETASAAACAAAAAVLAASMEGSTGKEEGARFRVGEAGTLSEESEPFTPKPAILTG
jgi:hypothetical protein